MSKTKWKRPPRAGSRLDPLPALHRGPLTLTSRLECFYCGDQVRYADATFDHIMPRSRAGNIDLADCADNLVVACSPCNTSKGTRTFDEWFEVLIDRADDRRNGRLVDDRGEREMAVIFREQAITSLIDYRNLDHINPNYEAPQVNR